MKETALVNQSNDVTDAEASTSSSVKYLDDESEDQKSNDSDHAGSASGSAKKFDDLCFKTPMLPHKRGNSSLTKKRTNGVTKNNERQPNCSFAESSVDELSEDSGRDSHVSTSLSQLSIDNFPGSPCAADSILESSKDTSGTNQPSNEQSNDFVDIFVSIGKHSYLCPRSRHYFATEFPDLPQKRSDTGEDLLKEIIIDEFSLLLFSSVEDYNILKMHEDELREREDAEEKRKTFEENVRLGKIKKKGRKSKMDTEKELRREKRELKKKERLERREARRLRKEEKERARCERSERRERLQYLTAEEKLIEKRREKKERREASIDTVSESKEARKARREEARERKLQEKLQKRQLKFSSALDATFAVAATTTAEDALTISHESGIAPVSASTLSSTSGTLPFSFCKSEPSTFGAASTSLIGSVNTCDDYNLRNTPSSMATAILGLNATNTTKNTDGIRSLSMTNQMDCTTTASISIPSMPNLIPVSSLSNSSVGIKRPASAIGIARNGIILSPLNNIDDSNGIILNSSIEPPPNKLKKFEAGSDELIKTHQNLTCICDSNSKAAISTLPNSSMTSLLKTEIKLENGLVHKNNVNSNSTTNNSQRSTPILKDTPSSSANGFLNHYNTSLTPGGPAAVVGLTPSLLAAAAAASSVPAAFSSSTTPSSSSSFMPPNLLVGMSNSGNSVTGLSTDPAVANLIQQSLLMNHPEFATLVNLHQQQQQAQQQTQSLPPNAAVDAAQQQQHQALMAAAAAAIGFPFFGISPQFLQQHQQQLEQLQKQNRLLSSMQQQATVLKHNSTAATLAGTASTTTTNTSAAGGTFPPPSSLLYGNSSTTNAQLPLASQLAGVAVLGKTPFLPSSGTQQQKNGRWSDRHVVIAVNIAKHTEMIKNTLLKQQQNITEVKAQQQQQRHFQQQQQQSQNSLAAVGKYDSLLSSNNALSNVLNRQNSTAPNFVSVAQAAAGLSMGNKTLLGNNFFNSNPSTSVSTLTPSFNTQQLQQKKIAPSPLPNAPMLIANVKHQEQQKQQQQQLMQMAALKQQQQTVQQQQMQMEAIRRFQQLGANVTPQQQQQQQQQNLLAQLHQQQLTQMQQHQHQQLKSTPTPSNSSNPSTAAYPQHSQTPMSAAVAAAAAAQRLLSPSTLLNSFYSSSSKQGSTATNSLPSMDSVQDQKHLLPHLPPQSNSSAHLQTSSAQPLATQTPTAATISQQQLNALGFSFVPSAQFGSVATTPTVASGASLTTGTSAQAHTLAASGGNALVNPNLMTLQQCTTPTNSNTNAAALAQMAMTQLMMQQIGAGAPPSSQINPLLQQQQQQQQLTANNFLSNLGLSAGAAVSIQSQQLPNGGSNVSSQQHQQQQQRISVPAPTTGTAATIVPTTSSANAVNLQQQQELLLQAALLQGIQSLETKHQQQTPANTSNNNATSSPLTVQQNLRQATSTNNSADLLRQQQLLFVEQLQQQQLMLNRLRVTSSAGAAGGGPPATGRSLF